MAIREREGVDVDAPAFKVLFLLFPTAASIHDGQNGSHPWKPLIQQQPPFPILSNGGGGGGGTGLTWNDEPVLKSKSLVPSHPPSALHYFDNEHPTKKKEKGRILLKDLRWIERCPTEEETRPHTFQLGYAQGEDYVVLCVQSKAEQETEEWVSLLRTLVRHNPELSETYHPQPWNNNKWPCCSESSRSARGCAQVSLTPSRLNLTDVIPPPIPPSVSTNNNKVGEISGQIVTAVYPFTAIEPGI
ncbi:unnamed protein product [Lepeophtheirus salmonis]|uniref:(salmon louse) hypothetical protein n=1 Tax=Lepeophtheirus salmonis TaxID=72036 RepID=A0A7R8CRF7_LEPSM|nr:unnamed protein product [Lepeophtheirus salmonis]CAF2904634.1 unnamed protein product [Lepeophtheirus salmonis]